MNGSFSHGIGGTEVPKDKTPLFHQCYKFDVNEATQWRVMNPITGTFIRSNIIRNLQMYLEEVNYLVKQYKSANDIMAELVKSGRKIRKNIFVVLRTPAEVNYQGSAHPGTLSQPLKNDINSFLYTQEPDGGPTKYGVYIVHRQHNGSVKALGYWNPLQDPLSYPILFPYGNSGYRRKDYKLNVDYVNKNEDRDRLEELRQEMDPFPFEGEDDELSLNKDCINYERARIRYKKYRVDNGEDVSDSEAEEMSFNLAADNNNDTDSLDGDVIEEEVMDGNVIEEEIIERNEVDVIPLSDEEDESDKRDIVGRHQFFHFSGPDDGGGNEINNVVHDDIVEEVAGEGKVVLLLFIK